MASKGTIRSNWTWHLTPIEVDHSQAVAVGLIVNELVTNSLKYAFPLRRGTVSVTLERVEPGRARLTVADDGIGMPADQVREGMASVWN